MTEVAPSQKGGKEKTVLKVGREIRELACICRPCGYCQGNPVRCLIVSPSVDQGSIGYYSKPMQDSEGK